MEKKAKRRRKWSTYEEKLRVEIWGVRITQLRGAKKKRNVEASPEEVRVKLHNFTSRYRKEKAALGPSGGSPSEWPLHGDIHAVVGTFKIKAVDILVEKSIRALTDNSIDSSTSISASTDEVITLVDDDGPSNECSPKRKRQKLSAQQKPISVRLEKIEDEIKKQTTVLQKTDAKLLQIETRRIELYEKFVNDVMSV